MLRRLVLVCIASCAVAVPLSAIGPAMALGFAHIRVVSANPVNYTPNVGNGTVLAIATVGNRVYVGGTFTTVTAVVPSGSAPVTRRYLFAFDRTTGRMLPFAPALDAPVDTIAPAPDGTSIIVGGRFSTVNGAAQRSLAMLRADGTRLATFRAQTNGAVAKVLVRGNRLVAGGRFSNAGGAARANLAVFSLAARADGTNGHVDPAFNLGVTEARVKPDGTTTAANVVEMDANATGSRLIIVGNFRRVAGQARMQIAAINLATNSLLAWSTQRYPNNTTGPLAFECIQEYHTPLRDVEFSPDGRFFVVVTSGGAPDRNVRSLCDTTARWQSPPATGGANSRETWFNCTGGDTLLSVAVTASADPASGGAVYVGGHQRWLDNCGGRDNAVAGSFAAPGIGAINAATGRAIRTWNPTRNPRGYGAEELVAQREGLYVGSDTVGLGREFHARLGLFPLG
jgi:hypothetical protein